MGGYGSTRWNRHYRQHTTNESYSFDIAQVSMRDIMADEHVKSTVWNWTSQGKDSGSMGIFFYPAQLEIAFKFQASQGDNAQNITQVIALETMALNFGGVRYWLRCPHCNKRVRTLHCPRSRALASNPFRCRTCWNLSYSSCQDSRHLSGSLYQIWGISDEVNALYSKVRRCHRGSKNYYRYLAKIERLESRFNQLLALTEKRTAILQGDIVL